MAFDWKLRRRQYDQQRGGAKKRGIPFLLTFEEWIAIWLASGKLKQRGCRRGQYVMARKGDVGPYAVDNVMIITAGENNRMFERTPKMRAKIAKKLRGVKHSLARRKAISRGHIGLRPDPGMLERRNKSIRKTNKSKKYRVAQSERMRLWWAERRDHV